VGKGKTGKGKRTIRIFLIYNMKWFGGILCIAMMSLLFTDCSKGGYGASETDPVLNFSDTTLPVIEINTPTADQEFKSGATVSITGKITDNSLYQGSINIKEEGTGNTIKDQLYEIHGLSSYNYTLTWIPSVTKITSYIITVAFEDHGLNKSSKSVKVKVNP
jgi:hypothetical protein